MLVSNLMKNIDFDGDFDNLDIINVCNDSRKVEKASAFVCIKGANFDGHDHAKKAEDAGASLIVCEHDVGVKNQLIVKNSRLAYAQMCENLFEHPASKMRLIGVTGTNGKTTITNLIKSILSSIGLKVGLVGTIQNEIGDEVIPSSKTTPDAYELQQLFSEMVEKGCEYVIMEVSSHALDQYRLGKTRFELSVFTNLTQDHLDYHKDMQDYFDAKKKLFEMSDIAIINIDDSYGRQLALILENETVTYSAHNPKADFYAYDIDCKPDGVEFHLDYNNIISKIKFAMPGLFSVQNALAAAAACLKVGICLEKVIKGLNSIGGVKGRSEVIPTGRDFIVVCDYAHTPDGLQNILPSLKQYAKGRLVTLFGCGGDRDNKKRPIMGEVAAKNSDYLIVTSDNPRTEDPNPIKHEIMVGVNKYSTENVVIPDRKQAIFYAIKNAQPNDIIVLAGKGHEDYQVLSDRTIHFDEREIVAEALLQLDE